MNRFAIVADLVAEVNMSRITTESPEDVCDSALDAIDDMYTVGYWDVYPGDSINCFRQIIERRTNEF